MTRDVEQTPQEFLENWKNDSWQRALTADASSTWAGNVVQTTNSGFLGNYVGGSGVYVAPAVAGTQTYSASSLVRK